MLKRPFQIPVLLLQFDGRPELLYKIEETKMLNVEMLTSR
jgi:hypothetical protein